MDPPPAKVQKIMASGNESEVKLNEAVKELRSQVCELKDAIKKLEKEIESLNRERQNTDTSNEGVILEIYKQITEKEKQITEIRKEITEIRKQITEKEKRIAEKENLIAEIQKATPEEFHVVTVPKSDNISHMASQGDSITRNISENKPVFAHWFGVQMCRAYESAQMQISQKKSPIKIEFDDEAYEIKYESLQNVVEATKAAAELHLDRNSYIGCRGFHGCPELRTAEIAFTCFFVRAIDRFIFPNETTGACLHQVPCRKRRDSGNPEVADLYILPFRKYFVPGDPVVLSDMKMNDLPKADRESTLYSAVGVEEGTSKDNFPVLIGIPSTTETTELQLHVNVHQKVWKLVIARSCPYDEALLCTLRAGVQHLIKYNCLMQTTPLKCPQPFENMDEYASLGPREHAFRKKDTNTVFKFYDRGIRMNENLNLSAMRELIERVQPLPQMKLTPNSNECRLYELSYTYVEGNHDPHGKLRSFIGVVSTLCKMHDLGLVHGDIRLYNMIFSDNGSCLIDFDFVGENATDCYPSDYNSTLPERHKNATPNSKMMFSHDRHSLKYIIERNVSGPAKAPILSMLESLSPLSDVLARLKSADN